MAAAAARARRTTSVCTGAFLLAEAGLLAGRGATTHWRYCAALAAGGRSQFSRALAAQEATRPALRELQAWITGHLDADLSVAALARRANLTERSFSQAFRRQAGQTPAAYVECLRVERARILLEDGAEPLHAVARATGFASAEVPRRAFHRRVGVSPAAYRERFRAAA